MFFTTMMYSTAIPCLYFAGLLICVSMYWSDKVLFLRHYRLPPRLDRNLSTRAHLIMEFAIILHLFTGVYMLSNPDIFTYKEEDHEGNHFISSLLERLFGLESERFQQPHTVLYLVGIIIFLICFILERVFGLMTKLVYCCCCGCIDLSKNRDSHSTDIYRELSREDQQHEFYMTNLKLKKNRAYLIKNNDKEDAQMMKYYR